MKRVQIIIPTLLFVLFAFSSLATAQVKNPRLENPKYGPDPETRMECLKNTSYYQEYYKQKNYKDAAHGWGIVYTICPRSSENIYIRGIRMIKASIEELEDTALRLKLVDSLMAVYDKRIANFRKEGYNLAQKGVDLYGYAPTRAKEAVEILRKAFELEKDNTEPQALLVLMQASKDLYAERALPADSILSLYSTLSGVFSRKIEADPKDEQLVPMSESLDAIFTSAGVANCENLISIYTPKLENAPEDLSLAKTIYGQLSAMRCTDSDLYLRAARLIFDKAPTATIGNEVARLLVARKKFDDADLYFQRAIECEEDSVRRSAMLVEYANFVGNNMGNKVRARALALDALGYNPNQGYAYFLIGSLYGTTKNCGASKIDNLSVFWAAVDKFNTAKSVDPSLAADCNKQINYFAQFFPSMEEIFYNDLEVGKSYTVPCWINERTTIRSKD